MQRSAISLAVLACCASCAAVSWAQTEPREATLPKVVVTGSHIAQIETESAVPLLVLRRADIERSGASTVKQLIDSIAASSQLSSGLNRALSDIAANNAYFSAGSSAVALRNLGPKATLVLLNSRRLAPFGMDDEGTLFVNVDTLPLDAIERVEVLRSGASAIYGSDAMAGVINIITRSNYQGVTLRAAHEQSQRSKDFRESTASLSAGLGDLAQDGYNVFFNAELYRRSGVVWRDVLGQVNPQSVRYAPSFGSRSTYSYPGNVIDSSGGASAVPGCAPQLMDSGLCMYDRYARLEAQPAAERVNLLLSGQYQLSGRTRGFAELLYSATETRYILANPAYGWPTVTTWVNPATGQSNFFYERGLPAAHPFNTTGIDEQEFRYRFEDADANFRVESTNYRALTGLRGTWGDFDWETALGMMGGRTDNIQHGAGYSVTGFRQVIGNDDIAQTDPQFFNRGYRIGQPNSPAVLNALFPTLTSRGITRQTFLDAKFSGPVGTIGGRPVSMAAGADLRHESLTIRPAAQLLAGDITGYGVAQSDAQRTFGSVFGELSLPVARNAEVQAAARLDKYPGFGAHLSPKLGWRVEASPQWLLRGNVEGGFRAPSLTEQRTSNLYSYAYNVADPQRCPQATALANDLLSAAAALPDADPNKALLMARADIITAQECANSVPSVRSNNPALKPEQSVGLTLGLVFEPARGHLLSADYWQINRRNEIGTRTPQEQLNAEGVLRAGQVSRTASGQDPSFTPAERALYGVTSPALSGIYGQYENTTKTRTNGVDLGWDSRLRSDAGTVLLGLSSTYLMGYYRYSDFLGAYGDNLAGRYQLPRWRGHVSAGLKTSTWTNLLRLNFNSSTKLQTDYYDTGYSDQGCLDGGWTLDDCRVRSATTVDYFLSYTGITRLSVSLFVRNLFNQRPPVDLRAITENGGGIIPQSLADVQGRSLRLALEYKF